MNVDPQDIENFDRLADTWWDPNGPSAPLHHLNPERLQFILDRLEPKAKAIIDIGCGGGLLTEALAQHGAEMTGIDMSERALQTAKMHASLSKLNIQYEQSTAEAWATQHAETYDAVTCLELLEHVPDPESLIQTCFKLVKPGGKVFFSTLNRNPKSFALGIVAAEYCLNLLPKGTHTYSQFIKPSELCQAIRDAGGESIELEGLHYNPLLKTCSRNHDLSINYLACATKPA